MLHAARLVPIPLALVMACTHRDSLFSLKGNEQFLIERADAVLSGEPSAAPIVDQQIVGDLDGDGIDDAVVLTDGTRAGDPAAVHVFYGGASISSGSVGERAHATLHLPASHFTSIAPAGDVDADGLADFLVGWSGYSCLPGSEHGRVHLIYGRTARLSGTLAVIDVASTIIDPDLCTAFGAAVGSLGDLDGDGHDDFSVVSATHWLDPVRDDLPGQNPSEGGEIPSDRTRIFYGGPTRLPAEVSADIADTVVMPTGGIHFAPIGLGDFDGDGRDDALFSEVFGAQLLLGRADRLAGTVAYADLGTTIAATSATDHDDRFVALGDLDADGLGDFAMVPMAATHQVVLFHGRPGGLAARVGVDDGDARLEIEEDLSVTSVAAGDLDGDGHRDLAIGVPAASDRRGEVRIAAGDGTRLAGVVAFASVATLIGDDDLDACPADDESCVSADGAGTHLVAGDLDDDDRADLLIGAQRRSPFDLGGRAYLVTSPGE